MDALELLKEWPGWADAGMETVLASPAWRMDAQLGGKPVKLVRGDSIEDPVALAVTFDGVPSVLLLADSPRYPDLHLLWSRRSGLPPEVVLALVEKECADVFLLLEQVTRRQFGITGFAPDVPASARAFAVQGLDVPLTFALDLATELLPVFGSLACLDPAHPSILAATREIRAHYATVSVSDDELAACVPGDFLLFPEAPDATPAWVTEIPLDESVHVVGASTQTATFEAFVTDGLPSVPPPVDLVLVKGGRDLATVRIGRVGQARALCFVERK